METRHQEDQIEREQRRISMGKAPSKIVKTARIGKQIEQFTYPVPPTQQYEKKRKSQIQDTVMSSPTREKETRTQI